MVYYKATDWHYPYPRYSFSGLMIRIAVLAGCPLHWYQCSHFPQLLNVMSCLASFITIELRRTATLGGCNSLVYISKRLTPWPNNGAGCLIIGTDLRCDLLSAALAMQPDIVVGTFHYCGLDTVCVRVWSSSNHCCGIQCTGCPCWTVLRFQYCPARTACALNSTNWKQ